MNYIVAFAVCLMGTFISALGGRDIYWLLVSDGNVALALFIAWYLGKGKGFGIVLNINVERKDQ